MKQWLQRVLVCSAVVVGLVGTMGAGCNLSAAEKAAVATAHGFAGSVAGYEMCKSAHKC